MTGNYVINFRDWIKKIHTIRLLNGYLSKAIKAAIIKEIELVCTQIIIIRLGRANKVVVFR